MVGKFGEFYESSVIRQTISIQIILVLIINNLLADLLIRQTFFCPNARKESIRQTLSLPNFPTFFPLYDIVAICLFG